MKVGCPEELLFDLVEGEEHREVALADGALSYAVASCRSGPCAGTIVLIHGVGSNASRWEEFTDHNFIYKSTYCSCRKPKISCCCKTS